MSRNSRSARSAPGARLAVDIGGTFTDVVLQAGGRLWTTKVLTTPTAPETGLLEAMQTVLADASMTARELDLLILQLSKGRIAIKGHGAYLLLVVNQPYTHRHRSHALAEIVNLTQSETVP